MRERVQMRPTLFERQAKLSAKQNAEKRYQEVLKKEGLQEQELVSLTKPPPQAHRKGKRVSRRRMRAKNLSGGNGGSEFDLISLHSRMTRTNSISLGSEYELASQASSSYQNVE